MLLELEDDGGVTLSGTEDELRLLRRVIRRAERRGSAHGVLLMEDGVARVRVVLEPDEDEELPAG